jgi:hypothetical protein
LHKQTEAWRYIHSHLNNKELGGALKKRFIHGGAKSNGRRKEFRPLSTKDSIHLVLKSSRAKGIYSFLYKENPNQVKHLLYKQARKFFVKITHYANVGNHLHLEVKITARKEFQQFLRSVTCLIARKVTGARRGKKFGRFWDNLAFTRVLKSFAEHRILNIYIMANQLEAIGGHEARSWFLTQWYG